MIISSSPSEVMRAPANSSSAETDRLRPGPETVTTAPVPTATTGSSADGSAWAMLPPAVPLDRIAVWPIHRAASASSG
jgi:hypothetical protein